MRPPERFNLRWVDFEANARLSFKKLRNEKEFNDVTVVADCGKQIEANKMVLARGSSFFHKILRENPHPHPLIYLKGVGYKHLVYLVDFVYTGETGIVEDDLNDFLDIAHDLRVKGLTMPGTLETPANQTSSPASLPTPANQTTSRASLPNHEAAREPCPSPRVSHPHPRVTSSAPDPHQGQVAVEEHGMLSQSRSQIITPTCPSSHPSQVFSKESSPSALSQLHSAKSSVPRGQDAANVTAPSPCLKSAHQYQVIAEQRVQSCRLPYSSSIKSDSYQGQLATEEATHSLGMQRPRSIISSHLKNDSCEDHDNTGLVKVEVVDYSVNDHAEAYISHVSIRGLEENGENEDIEGIMLAAEPEKNKQVTSTWKEPKEEIIEWSNDVVVTEVADGVFEDEQTSHDWYQQAEERENVIHEPNEDDWYEQVEERENMIRGRNDDDCYEQAQERENMIHERNEDNKNNMIPDSEQDFNDKTKSSDDTDFHCFLCSITFTTSSQLRRHKKSHVHEKLFIRPVRSEMSPQMGSSEKRIHAKEEHLQRNPTGDKHYQGLLSSKKKYLGGKLNRDKLIHTGDKPYQCGLCYKSFSWMSHLKQHKITHTGEKPHQCLLCPKSFSLLCNLNKHKMTHTGEKTHHCDLCSKSFSRLENLKRHKMTHTGEKPHQCDLCSKSFSRLGILKLHKMKHTGKKP